MDPQKKSQSYSQYASSEIETQQTYNGGRNLYAYNNDRPPPSFRGAAPPSYDIKTDDQHIEAAASALLCRLSDQSYNTMSQNYLQPANSTFATENEEIYVDPKILRNRSNGFSSTVDRHLTSALLSQTLDQYTTDNNHQTTIGQAGLPLPYGSDLNNHHKAVAFIAGPRERIHVLGNPVEGCPRCKAEGIGNTSWRPHRHIGELKIRYICERHFEDLESTHHFDIPLCPACSQVLYIYEFNAMLGVSNARRLHKFVLKCHNRHVLPLLDLFCQTKKGGERCNANFKLQWCYGTMVKRCESQKNRDHDLWWVRYKNEWKQRRTIIRYKKDFLSHLSDSQRGLLLGLGLEGEPPPDPKAALGPTFDALINAASSPLNSSPVYRKRVGDRALFDDDGKRRRPDEYFGLYEGSPFAGSSFGEETTRTRSATGPSSGSSFEANSMHVVTGTPTQPLSTLPNGQMPVAASIVGEVWSRPS